MTYSANHSDFYNREFNLKVTGAELAYIAASLGAVIPKEATDTVRCFGLSPVDLDTTTLWEEFRDAVCDLAGTEFNFD